MSDAERGRPDAVLMPAQPFFMKYKDQRQREWHAAAAADAILQCDRDNGERSRVRTTPDARLFAARDPSQGMFFPKDHPKRGKPRYEWKELEGAEGVKVGWLLPDDEGEPEPSPAAAPIPAPDPASQDQATDPAAATEEPRA